MDVTDVIANYLRDNHRRLVVPAFGAFVVKESGEVLFSELLKTDDGVLRGLLAAGGLSELECAGLIDRFIFDVRNALSEKGRFDMGGFGGLTIGADGEIRFVSPAAAPTEKTVGEPAVPKAAQSAKTVVSKPDTFRAETQSERERPRVAVPRRRESRKRGVDWFVVAAVVVLLAAVAVIVYGYFCSAEQDDEAMMDSLRWQIEQPASDNK